MDVLRDLGATIYIDDVFIADDTEEEHLEKLQKVIKRLTEAGLKLNLKKCQFGQFEVTYLGFQVATDLGLSEGYKEKLEQITPQSLKTIYRRFWDSAITLETMYHTTKNSYTLSSVEKKYPQEEKELAVLARHWGALKELAQGQGIKVITQSQVHRFLRKGTIEGTKATNARWGRWEDILLDPDLELGPTPPTTKKQQTTEVTQEEPYEWVLYTDGSKKGLDNTAYWGYILKQNEKEKHRQKGRVPGSAQAGEVTRNSRRPSRVGEAQLSEQRSVGWSKCVRAWGCLGLRTDNGTHFRNAQVDQWCQQNGVIRIYSPPYTPQANGVVERTIGLVKNWIGNANTKAWSTKALEVGRALNDSKDRCSDNGIDSSFDHPVSLRESHLGPNSHTRVRDSETQALVCIPMSSTILVFLILDGSGCIHCGVPFKQTLHLWDVASALWCDQCYKNHFPIQTARGLACHNDVNYVPVVTMEEILDIEVNAKVMWHSIAAGKDQLMPSAIYQDCVYCTIYTKLWEFPEGQGISTAHLMDGRICGSRTAPANTSGREISPGIINGRGEHSNAWR
ncbi:hypothetical protein L3Q82_012104 [Scortum barcoo]|uniref:Uncharacterized protein n=1 Tax=Scortum barcoo TaxID=214431 RepID=A0ACB8W8G0_9TELE|nr:hypothetical protein L3Q82_012104 [Scortum barcoo]